MALVTDSPEQISGEFLQEDVDPTWMDLLDFAKVKVRLDKLIGEWATEVAETETRRNLRYVDIDVDAMRKNNEIAPDETFVPDRVIDVNISREHPIFAKFLKGSRRLAIFHSLDDPEAQVQQLELDFTKGLTYPGWYLQFFREVDGAATHGWDAIEVVLDTTKPLNIGFEHIGHDNLYFNRKIEDFQSSELVIRRYKVTTQTLEMYVAQHGFDRAQVDIMINRNSAEKKQDVIYDIFKLYFKYLNVVYVGWFSNAHGTDNWLKAPVQLDLGIVEQISAGSSSFGLASIMQGGLTPGLPAEINQPRPVDMYPIFIFPYKEDEDKEVTAKVGRCFLDEYRQEAHTTVLTSFINSLIRSSYVFGSPENGDEDGPPKQLDLVIKRNMIFDKKMNFWSFPQPEATVLQALQFFGALNANQTGQLDYAVMNRQDARKTAEEMKVASQESDDLKSVSLSFYSEHLREIFAFVWVIVQSQAKQGLVKIALIKQQQTISGPMGEQIPIGVSYVNDVELISQNFDIRPAGDTDVIQREAKIRQMKEDWAVISQTALANRFLQDLMRLQYPDMGDEYAKILEAGDPVKALLQSIVTVLQGALQPEEFQALSPQEQNGLQQIQQQVQQILGEGATFIPNVPKPPKVTTMSIGPGPGNSIQGQKIEHQPQI